MILPNSIPYKQQCYTDYMYGKDDSWENLLASYESSLAYIIDKIKENQKITLEEEATVKSFILYQHLRTEKAIDNNNFMLEQMITKLIPIVTQMENIKFNPFQTAMFAKQYVQNNHPRVVTATMNLEFAKSYSNSLNDLKLLILHSANNEFVCSDAPVIMDNLFQPENGLGIECVGIIFIMPVSLHYAIILYDNKIYNIDKQENENIIEITDEETRQINYLSFLFARELLFSCNQKNLIDIKRYFDRKYIDKPLRDIFLMFGIVDPILIGIEISKLKKSKIKIIDETIPKFFAKKADEIFPIVKLIDDFRPYKNDLNANFSRKNTLQELSFKMSYWDKNYCDLVRKYLA